MTCPECGTPVSEPLVLAPLTICPGCLHSLVVTEGTVRLARAEHTVPLTQAQLGVLRKARKRAREARPHA